MENGIRRALEFMEENLTNELTVESCAHVSGYTKGHFIRLFSADTGVTPARYIRRRRISEAAKSVISGGTNISDAAFACGFNSKENFLRAFRAEHGVLPHEFRRAQNSLRLFDKFDIKCKFTPPQAKIIEMDAFYLTISDLRDDYAPRMWNRYNCRGISIRMSGGDVCEDYGVCDYSGEKMRYLIGIKTDAAHGDISGTRQYLIPSGTYAVFETPPADQARFVQNIHSTWNYIHTKWLPQSGFIKSSDPDFESYDETSRTFSEKIYISIRRM